MPPPSRRAGGRLIGRAPLVFIVLLFGLSAPFLLFGAGGRQLLPGLPASAVMVVCPALAALILSWRERGSRGAAALLARAFDGARIRHWAWYAPLLLIPPLIAVAAFAVLRLFGTPVPYPQFGLAEILLLSALFFVSAIGEELGWSGYAIDPLQVRLGPLPASLLLGAAWAAWHVPALLQAHRGLEWIAWWTLGTVAARVIMVRLYNQTGRSVFGMALFHASSNLAWQMFPIHGSFFDPRVNGVITALVALVLVLIWGAKTPVRSLSAARRETRRRSPRAAPVRWPRRTAAPSATRPNLDA